MEIQGLGSITQTHRVFPSDEMLPSTSVSDDPITTREVTEVNEALKRTEYDVKFSMNDDTLVLSVYVNGEVIREIPNEMSRYFMDNITELLATKKDLVGALLDEIV
jgi:uncharacterized FlaG/YvyC family protein